MSHIKNFLGTTDWKIETNLLNLDSTKSETQTEILPSFSEFKSQQGLSLLVLDNLLSKEECDLITSKSSKNVFEEMERKYPSEERNNRRLIVKDEQTSELIWKRLEKIVHEKFQENQISTTPLGFGVRGEWNMYGVNNALRINQYSEEECFALHKDAQFAPNGDERSLMSIIIYLSEDFEKGETQFYFPKSMNEKEKIRKGSTIEEEVSALGGLEKGYDLYSVVPKVGRCVLFSHNLLHASVPPQKKANAAPESEPVIRVVLRSDLLVQR